MAIKLITKIFFGFLAASGIALALHLRATNALTPDNPLARSQTRKVASQAETLYTERLARENKKAKESFGAYYLSGSDVEPISVKASACAPSKEASSHWVCELKTRIRIGAEHESNRSFEVELDDKNGQLSIIRTMSLFGEASRATAKRRD